VRIPGGFGFPFGVAAGVGATALTVAVGATAHPVRSLVALVAVVDASAVLTTLGATAATAAFCWCLQAGFVLGRQGDLVFTAESGRDALVLALSAVAAAGFAAAIRAARRRADTRPVARIPEQRRGGAVTGAAAQPALARQRD
jgi:hypothetical protein